MSHFESDLNLDLFWLNKISYKLDKFKLHGRANGHPKFNCRCPVCGDSKRKQNLKRFWIYVRDGQLVVKCFNCSYSRTFYNFMKDNYQADFDEYKKSLFKSKFQKIDKPRFDDIEEESVDVNVHNNLAGCVSVTELDKNHIAVKYLRSRKFDESYDHLFYYSEDFKVLAEALSYSEINERFPSEPRLVIPFYNEDGTIKCVQGRSFNQKSDLKYITIKTNESSDKIYGLERVDRTKTVYCCEGPFDSLLVDNCVATCDATLTNANADVYIWDNEPMNKIICGLMNECIDLGFKIVIWPTRPFEKNDINDMIKQGMSKEEVMNIIKNNTYNGLRAKMKFIQWKRL